MGNTCTCTLTFKAWCDRFSGHYMGNTVRTLTLAWCDRFSVHYMGNTVPTLTKAWVLVQVVTIWVTLYVPLL